MAIHQNENIVDRFARIILGGACMLSASYIPDLPSPAILVLLVAGLYLMFSGLAGHCFLYRLLGVKTCK